MMATLSAMARHSAGLSGIKPPNTVPSKWRGALTRSTATGLPDDTHDPPTVGICKYGLVLPAEKTAASQLRRAIVHVRRNALEHHVVRNLRATGEARTGVPRCRMACRERRRRVNRRE